jgi:hypothetical protein
VFHAIYLSLSVWICVNLWLIFFEFHRFESCHHRRALALVGQASIFRIETLGQARRRACPRADIRQPFRLKIAMAGFTRLPDCGD